MNQNYSIDFKTNMSILSFEDLINYKDILSNYLHRATNLLFLNEENIICCDNEKITEMFPCKQVPEENIDESYEYNEEYNDDYYEDEEYDDYYDEYDDDYDEYEFEEYQLLPLIRVEAEFLKNNNNGDKIKLENIELVILDKNKGLLLDPKGYFCTLKSEQINNGSLNIFNTRIISEIESNFIEQIGITLLPIEVPLNDEHKKEFLLTELDQNNSTAFNQIITGETGCGKTYKAINDEIELGRKFIYLAPCRQLVYESFRYYANPQQDYLTTGEIKLGNKSGNIFAVYESATPEMLKNVDTIIIDEAHFINDTERGGQLLNIIADARANNINLKLLTATQSFSLNDFDEIHLKSRFKVPDKIEISSQQAMDNIKSGMQTIIFVDTIAESEITASELQELGINAVAMNSSLTPSERLQVQIDFENKKTQVVVSTNVLAQGVNFECENLIINSDYYNTPELLNQKLGRLGRPGTLIDKNEVYYCTEDVIPEVKKSKRKTKIEKSERNDDFIQNALNNCIGLAEDGYEISYNNLKYCIPEFQKMAQQLINDDFPNKQILINALNMIEEEQNALKQIILTNMRKKLILEQKKPSVLDILIDKIKEAQSNNLSYISFGKVNIPFQTIECSDLVKIKDFTLNIKNKEVISKDTSVKLENVMKEFVNIVK